MNTEEATVDERSDGKSAEGGYGGLVHFLRVLA
jgi:hypothetical protein